MVLTGAEENMIQNSGCGLFTTSMLQRMGIVQYSDAQFSFFGLQISRDLVFHFQASAAEP
jgi:hypothetical protein